MFRHDIGKDIDTCTNPISPADAHFGVQDIGWQVLIPAVVCTALSTAVVAVRWYTRLRLARCIGADDYVILLSLALSCTMTTIIGAEVHHGSRVFDTHVPASTVAKLVVINNDLWILTVNTTKVSILIQYLRIFLCRRTRILCVILMSILLPVACWGIFGGTFLCIPTAKLWHPDLRGHCMSAHNYWFSVAGMDIVLDFLILLLPLPAVMTLRLPRKQKSGLALVFLLGFFVCVVSVIRLFTVLVTSLRGEFGASGVWAIIWSAVEANVGIVCASLLALKPLVAKLFPRLVEEVQPPRHSLRLPMLEAGVWPREPEEASLRSARSASIPTTPITTTSKRSSNGTRSSTRLSLSQWSRSPEQASQVI